MKIHDCLEANKTIKRQRKLINDAVSIAVRYGGIDGSHHKDWVIDQIIRTLSGKDYDDIIAAACAGEDGPDTYEWNTGIAP
jgi:hypothetical protein